MPAPSPLALDNAVDPAYPPNYHDHPQWIHQWLIIRMIKYSLSFKIKYPMTSSVALIRARRFLPHSNFADTSPISSSPWLSVPSMALQSGWHSIIPWFSAHWNVWLRSLAGLWSAPPISLFSEVPRLIVLDDLSSLWAIRLTLPSHHKDLIDRWASCCLFAILCQWVLS